MDSECRTRYSYPPIRWLRSPTGRGSGLKIHTVWVRIPPELLEIEKNYRKNFGGMHYE